MRVRVTTYNFLSIKCVRTPNPIPMRAILLILLFSGKAFAQDASINIFIAGKGEWEMDENWSLHKIPSSGEIVIVPSPAMVIINNSIYLETLDITIAGQLVLQNAALVLEKGGRLIIAETGSITGSNNADEEQFRIGKQTKYISSADSTGYCSWLSGKPPLAKLVTFSMPSPKRFMNCLNPVMCLNKQRNTLNY